MENLPTFGQLRFDENSFLAFARWGYWVNVRDRILALPVKDGRIAFSDVVQILEEPTNELLQRLYQSLGPEQHQAISVAWNKAVEMLQTIRPNTESQG